MVNEELIKEYLRQISSDIFYFPPYIKVLFFFLFFKDFIYLFMGDTDRERQIAKIEKEKQAPCRKPDTGLDLSLIHI